jgi:hypothetical protein
LGTPLAGAPTVPLELPQDWSPGVPRQAERGSPSPVECRVKWGLGQDTGPPPNTHCMSSEWGPVGWFSPSIHSTPASLGWCVGPEAVGGTPSAPLTASLCSANAQSWSMLDCLFQVPRIVLAVFQGHFSRSCRKKKVARTTVLCVHLALWAPPSLLLQLEPPRRVLWKRMSKVRWKEMGLHCCPSLGRWREEFLRESTRGHRRPRQKEGENPRSSSWGCGRASLL